MSIAWKKINKNEELDQNLDLKDDCLPNLLIGLFLFQYYEMSYGLNVEMHKQVCTDKYIL